MLHDTPKTRELWAEQIVQLEAPIYNLHPSAKQAFLNNRSLSWRHPYIIFIHLPSKQGCRTAHSNGYTRRIFMHLRSKHSSICWRHPYRILIHLRLRREQVWHRHWQLARLCVITHSTSKTCLCYHEVQHGHVTHGILVYLGVYGSFPKIGDPNLAP